MTLIVIGCPSHYLNVMNSVIILKMGWMNTIGPIFIPTAGIFVDILVTISQSIPLVVRFLGKIDLIWLCQIHLLPRDVLPYAWFSPIGEYSQPDALIG